MNKPLKFVLLGLALLLFIGSFFWKGLYPANPDLAEYCIKGFAIAILAFVVVRTRMRKRPFDPF
jgi:hypothetical protein